MKIRKVFILIIFVLFFCSYSYSQDYHWLQYLTSDNSMWIDWTDYKIYSEIDVKCNEFIDKDIIIKNRRIILLNKIYNTILNINLDKEHKVKDLLHKKSAIQIWDELNDNDVLSLIKLDKNYYKIILECKLTPSILQNMITQQYLLSTPKSIHPKQVSMDFLSSYSGVLIEVNTDKFFPFFYVYLYTSDGKLFFSPSLIEYDTFLQNGMALYLTEKNKELIKKRAGKNPLILQANSIFDGIKNSLKLTEHSSFYLNFKRVIELIKKGKLVILKKKYSPMQKESINEFELNE